MNKGSETVVTIETLGDFDIRIQDESILNSVGNQARLIKLFKYFLTFEGKKILAAYKKIRLKAENVSSNVVINTLDKELKEPEDQKDALICDNFYFRFLYNLKLRTIERDKLSILLESLVLIKQVMVNYPKRKLNIQWLLSWMLYIVV